MDVSSIGTVAGIVQAEQARETQAFKLNRRDPDDPRAPVRMENEACARMVEGLGVATMKSAESLSGFTYGVSKIMRDMLVDLATEIRKRVQP